MPVGSDKHGPLEDEQLKQGTENLERATRESRSEEQYEQQAPGDDQPEPDPDPEGTRTGGSPPGMAPGDVQWRSAIARSVETSVFPCVREPLIEDAINNHAPDNVVEVLRHLPAGREFQNTQEVWESLGGHVEEHRS